MLPEANAASDRCINCFIYWLINLFIYYSWIHICRSWWMIIILFSSVAQWMVDIYFPPWCRAGPYFVGVLLGYVLYRVNGRLKIHPVSASLFKILRPKANRGVILRTLFTCIGLKVNNVALSDNLNGVWRLFYSGRGTTALCDSL